MNEFQTAIEEAGFTYKLDTDFSPKFVVGYVETKEKHPDADKLSVLRVDVATEKLQIVCGAANEAGQKVVVAKVGAVMPSGMVIRMLNLGRCVKWYDLFNERVRITERTTRKRYYGLI